MVADEPADVAVLEQLIIFIKCVDPQSSEARTEFLPTKYLHCLSGKATEGNLESLQQLTKAHKYIYVKVEAEIHDLSLTNRGLKKTSKMMEG